MTSENNGPDTQNEQDNQNAPGTAERQRISRLANDLAKASKRKAAPVRRPAQHLYEVVMILRGSSLAA
jgi:hypothetical protein